MRHRFPTIVGLGILALAQTTPASAGIVLSFDQISYAIGAPGGTVALSVFAAQTPGGPQVGPGNELITGAILVSFDDPAGIAAVAAAGDVTPGPLFDSGSAGVSPTDADLSLLSLAGLILPNPLLLGTFTFTGLAPGVTTIRVSDLDPLSLDFTTVNLDDLDAVLTGGTATITVADAAAVPEPATLVSAAIAALAGLGYSWRRRGPST